MTQSEHSKIKLAQDGDAAALEDVVRSIQDRVFRLATRMLADPVAAQDATQEILIRIVTKLSTYRGDSAFETWVYRVATNYLLTARKMIANDPGLSFEMFSDDLLDGLADDRTAAAEDHVMLNELRVRCTMAMLLCLDRDHRAAYVLGEILELDHREAASIVEVSPANFRKRLSRARRAVQAFTAASCGLTTPTTAACTCRKRLPAAMASGRIGPTPSPALSGAPSMSEAQTLAAETEAGLVAAKLQRATGPLTPLKDFAADVLRIVDPPG
ncbi:RNA polymerase sigma factor [uncultured Litoreibacter sp.]|uniref:RNA polymerase sigma factor n=1 Tax=uncultured Litoreibacter sp. TaxID=1392394 RepID=UPI002637546A|nr:RNA polymerase sigma factor [uncultured Litoreibacter sp.]